MAIETDNNATRPDDWSTVTNADTHMRDAERKELLNK